MSARLLEGRPVADALWASIQRDTAQLAETNGRPPCLAIVQSEDAAAVAYARQIERAFTRRGLAVVQREPPHGADRVRRVLTELSHDRSVDGVLVMTPLPGDVDLQEVIGSLDPAKDVDGQHPSNLGRLVQRRRRFVPSTALGGLHLLEHYGVTLKGTRAVVVGRSPIVGLPLSLLLVDADATVTICHTRTADIGSVTREADLLCVAAGRVGLIGARHVKPGAVVVDFGTNPGPDGGLVGDAIASEVAAVAGALTPVPGGTGPVTVAVLARQTVLAAAPGASTAV